MLHKFVDDSTLTEIFKRGDHLNNVIEWSRYKLTNVNYKKTKEMLCAVNGNEIDQLTMYYSCLYYLLLDRRCLFIY